jgi:hypothetical protein
LDSYADFKVGGISTFFSEDRLNSVWKQADSRYNLRASAGLSARFVLQIIGWIT